MWCLIDGRWCALFQHVLDHVTVGSNTRRCEGCGHVRVKHVCEDHYDQLVVANFLF